MGCYTVNSDAAALGEALVWCGHEDPAMDELSRLRYVTFVLDDISIVQIASGISEALGPS